MGSESPVSAALQVIVSPHGNILPSVAIVFDHDDRVAGLLDAQRAITRYADPTESWTLERASSSCLPLLMKYLLGQAKYSHVDKHYVGDLWNQSLNLAVARGDIPMLDAHVAYFRDFVIVSAPVVAATSGQIHVIEWLRNQGPTVYWSRNSLREAARGGYLAILRRLPFVLTMQDQIMLIYIALQSKRRTVVEWLWVQLAPTADDHVLERIVAAAPLPLARWMQRTAMHPLPICIVDAARRGDLAYLQWARSQPAKVGTVYAMDEAARGGFLDVVIELHGSGARCSTQAIDGAATEGHMDVVIWLFDHREEGCSSDALLGAASNGHLDIFRALLVRGVPCPDNVVDVASARGHLEVVKFVTRFRLGGGSSDAVDGAAANGHFPVLSWLFRHRRDGYTAQAFDGAARLGDLGLVTWLARQNVRVTSAAIDNAAAGGHLQVVEWLTMILGGDATPAAVDSAASGGYLRVVKWLLHHRDEGCTVRALDGAMANGHYDTVEWLFEHRDEGCSAVGVDATCSRHTIPHHERTRLRLQHPPLHLSGCRRFFHRRPPASSCGDSSRMVCCRR